jgi:aldehyde dehydrogenase (NAD+)
MTRLIQTPEKIRDLLATLGLKEVNDGGCLGPGGWVAEHALDFLISRSPATGKTIARVALVSETEYESIVRHAHDAFLRWRTVPAPRRGQLIRSLGNRLREFAEPLGELVSLEMGKIRAEGIGEVQEMIDICDFAVGLSRQLCGSTMHSERPGHRMYEQWHPLGVTGIISAFNFPVAVWAWNAALAAVCGNTMIWKPSPQTPLTAIAVQHICNAVMDQHGEPGIFNLAIGTNETIGERLVTDRRVALVSFTGSCEVGRTVAEKVSRRLGKVLLELGGNNAMIIESDADIELAVRAIVFGAIGTAGQRCTTTRRLLVHNSIIDKLLPRLVAAWKQVLAGDPLDQEVLLGPLVNEKAVETMNAALKQAIAEGGTLVCGGNDGTSPVAGLEGNFVCPAIVRMPSQTDQVRTETFAPILYVIGYDTLDEAIAIQNDVPQGLSSSIFTTDLRKAEQFLSAAGSDCGIANVNIGTSGAEIGGAFGGEKDTGGGRESGSDAWKAYMRRQTNTINWSRDLPLAQGIRFG